MKLPLCEYDCSQSLSNDEFRVGGASASTPHVSSFLTQRTFTVLLEACVTPRQYINPVLFRGFLPNISPVYLILYAFCVIDINLGKDILISN
jgi:hypothetical protein